MFKRIALVVLLGCLLCGIQADASVAERYKWIVSTDKMTVSYDTQTVQYNTNSSSKTVDVWIKLQFTEDGVKEFVDNHPSGKKDKYNNFSFLLTHYIFNSKNQMQLLEAVSYDTNNKVIESAEQPSYEQKWEAVIPESVGEAMYNTFASYLKK